MQRALDKVENIKLLYEGRQDILRCIFCNGIIAEGFEGKVLIQCSHCGKKQEIETI